MATTAAAPPVRRVEPLCRNWRTAAWAGGLFDTASRDLTPFVEGTILLPHPLILVTLRGGAERLEVQSDCGHRYAGPDRVGAVSFVPAQSERRLKLTSVKAEWASIALLPSAFDGLGRMGIGAFTNLQDPFLAAMVAGFAAQLAADGALEPLWCEAMGRAAAAHLICRYGQAPAPPAVTGLAAWQMRRITEYVHANLGGRLPIAEVAALAGLSIGHFHRAFRKTTGRTPLNFINDARIQRAQEILATENAGMVALATRVGFASPGHFARVFRARTGVYPSMVRRR